MEDWEKPLSLTLIELHLSLYRLSIYLSENKEYRIPTRNGNILVQLGSYKVDIIC
ncbi:hypothetical protein WN55_10097 [Dufourea novaeangliae]|uniref:Uncharacterized protein n=1 Tax=Dufourea novaeangliae TaxID=178035 RepID=A0A154P4Q0_DUFNO|nr:hypothetical protein WN55_10097 [Dufourea novaeangliae]